MAKVQIIVCDVCEDTSKPVTSYRISRGAGEPARSVDLCKQHSKALDELYEKGTVRRRSFNELKETGTKKS